AARGRPGAQHLRIPGRRGPAVTGPPLTTNWRRGATQANARVTPRRLAFRPSRTPRQGFLARILAEDVEPTGTGRQLIDQAVPFQCKIRMSSASVLSLE